MPTREVSEREKDLQKEILSKGIESSLLRDAYFQLKETIKKLEESEAKYSTLVEEGNDGILIVDADGVLRFVNSVICGMTGYSKEETIGTSLLDYVLPEYKELVAERLKKRLQGEVVPGRYEISIFSKEGKETPVEVNASAIVFEGKPAVMAIVRDITERKGAEMELKERDAHAQSLLRLSRRLEQSQTYAEALDAARDEVRAVIGYQSLWAYLLTEDKKYAHALVAGGPVEQEVMSEKGTATLTIEGDPMLEKISAAQEIVIVEDARTDPNVNREIVMKLGNRTIVNVPIILFDRHLGSIGTGTFGEEGVRIPTDAEQRFLMALASHMAVTFDRISLLTERKQFEAELVQKNRVLRMLSDINQTLIHTTDETLLLHEACRIVGESGGVPHAVGRFQGA